MEENKNPNHSFGVINPAIVEAFKNFDRSLDMALIPQKQTVLPTWKCECGTENTARYCSNCNTEKPKELQKLRCSKCGWIPTPEYETPKFCIECGTLFTEEDIF